MGLFDFLNPKKKIEKMLSDKVLNQAVEKATKVIKEKGEEKAKDEIKNFAAEEMKKHASSVIPGPFQDKAGEIIDKAAEKLADRAIEEAKKVAGIK
jgi:two-component SAPR family response regulator